MGILGGFRKKAVTWRVGTAHRSIERLLVDLEGLHQVARSAATAVVLDGRAGGKRRRLENRGHLGIADHEDVVDDQARRARSEEHTSQLQSLMRISYAVFCLKKKK